VDHEALCDLDRQMQDMIEKQFNSIIQICVTSTDVRVNVEGALMQLARKYMHDRLGGVDVTELFLRRSGERERAQKAVTGAFAFAEPTLEAPDAPNDVAELLAVPVGPSCQHFLQLVAQHLTIANPTIAASPDDIIFYRERVTVPLKCLPHLGA